MTPSETLSAQASQLLDHVQRELVRLSAGPKSLPKIVYVRFPEWTVWVLPPAAGELWPDISRRPWGPRLGELSSTYFRYAFQEIKQSQTRPTGWPTGKKTKEKKVYEFWDDNELLKDCFADMFGTFTLGPRYARASIFLYLKPFDDNDRIRAETIFHVMRKMNGSAFYSGVLGKSVAAMEKAWDQAVRESGRENGQAPEKAKRRADPRADIAIWRENFLQYLTGYVTGIGKTKFEKLRFPLADWEGGEDQWVKYFLSPNPAKASPDAPETTRIALAAAWETRIRDPNAPGTIRLALAAAWEARIRDPLKSKEIAEACKKLCEYLAEKSGPEGPPEPPQGQGFENTNL